MRRDPIDDPAVLDEVRACRHLPCGLCTCLGPRVGVCESGWRAGVQLALLRPLNFCLKCQSSMHRTLYTKLCPGRWIFPIVKNPCEPLVHRMCHFVPFFPPIVYKKVEKSPVILVSNNQSSCLYKPFHIREGGEHGGRPDSSHFFLSLPLPQIIPGERLK